ncbi:putative membrane protein [Pullulanibacillus pueri]|uniref:SHOCT domain-containing protein n=1 Tax=Pullulanibacillus pueri TaxID=1437324 RepID=A0A8J2ZRA4_9BACL|nr:hypothetical protein [Pullulanibacillus pueri]MBM7679849.1 putative membrane protein [Pullulanibacillus pueri]GGH73142.1 hypothetical protein GCM10007096_00070 [Pullulanibacillus pueri]
MGLDHHSFTFFPFGALFCLTLLCFVAVRVFAIRYRYKDSKQQRRDILAILKRRVAEGTLDEGEFQRLKELLSK